jgi:hypothetical protein
MKTWDPKLAPPHLVSAEATVGSYLIYYASTKIYDSAPVLRTWAATVLYLFCMLEISTESNSHHVNTHRPLAPTYHFRAPTPSRMFWRKGREREFNLVIVVESQSTDAGSYSHLPAAHPFIHSFIHSPGFLSFFLSSFCFTP